MADTSGGGDTRPVNTDGWPPIDDADLLARLRAPDADLYRHFPAFARRMPAGATDPDVRRRLAWGRGYPFVRAPRQVVLRGGRVTPGNALPDDAPRWALLAIGSNAAPERLAAKLAGVDDDALLLTPAVLHDHDVAALPYPVTYGAFPAGLVHSPGTRVDVAVLDVTLAQLSWLAFSEFGYHFGALEGCRVDVADGRRLERAFVFVQRVGLFAVDGEPVALVAVPAADRTLPAMSQEALLDLWARRRFGGAEDVRERLVEALADPGAFIRHLALPSAADAVHPQVPGFARHPASRPA